MKFLEFKGYDGGAVFLNPEHVTSVQARVGCDGEALACYVTLVGDAQVTVKGSSREVVEQLTTESKDNPGHWIWRANEAQAEGRTLTAAGHVDEAVKLGASMGHLSSGLTSSALESWRKYGRAGK